jgi:aryl-alcohol dehydrogenase-like predicted oxidoreductase
MFRNDSSRREFLRRSAALAAAGAATAAAIPAFGLDPRQEEKAPKPEGSAPGRVPIEHRTLGKTGLSVAVLGFGGAEIGYERKDAALVERLLNGALDAGMNVIDTAECYMDSEELIAGAVGHRRKEYHLFTKCGHYAVSGGSSAWSEDGVMKSIERSLRRLKTDVIDLVQLHSCSIEELKKGACISGLEKAKKEGKTRFIGYSGDAEAARFAVESGRFDTLQTSLSFLDQEAIDMTLPLAAAKKMGVITKRTIGNAVWRFEKEPSFDYHIEYWKRLQALGYGFATKENVANEGPDGPAGIALRFVAAQPAVSVMLVGTSKPERWRQNAELLSHGPLSKEKVAEIRARWKQVAKPEWIGQT